MAEQVSDGVKIQTQWNPIVWLQSKARKHNNTASRELWSPLAEWAPPPSSPAEPSIDTCPTISNWKMVSRVCTLGRLLLWILCCQSSSMTQGMEGRERSWRSCSSWCQKFLSPHSLRWGRPATWLQLPSCLLRNVSGCTLLGSHGYNPRLPWILILNSFHLNTKESVWHDFCPLVLGFD